MGSQASFSSIFLKHLCAAVSHRSVQDMDEADNRKRFGFGVTQGDLLVLCAVLVQVLWFFAPVNGHTKSRKSLFTILPYHCEWQFPTHSHVVLLVSFPCGFFPQSRGQGSPQAPLGIAIPNRSPAPSAPPEAPGAAGAPREERPMWSPQAA